MSFTGQQLLDLSRETLNDTAKARYTDASLLLFANAALGTLALLRQDLFVQTISLTTTPASAEQDAASANADIINLYWVYRVNNGDAIQKCDMDPLSRFSPGWMTADAGTPENWMKHPEDAKQDKSTKYLLSPPPQAGVEVIAKVALAPTRTAVALGSAVPVPDPYMDALAHYIVFRAESKDDEHVVEQRATQAMTVFLQSINLAKEAKPVMNDGRST